MTSHTHRVPAALRPFVTSCVGYDLRLAPDATHRGLPSTSLTLIVEFDEPLDCGWLDGRDRARFDTLVAGLHTHPSLIHTHGVQRGIQIGLTPLGARALLRTPASALAGAIVDGDDEARLPTSLQRRLQDATWPRRFELLEEFLLGRLTPAALRPELAEAWRRVRASGGAVRVDGLAAHLGWSRRHLLTQFRAEFGITPKQASRLARFERARALLDAGVPLADAAHRCGYADQPHLHREWRALTGVSPAQTAAEFQPHDAGP